MRTREFIYVATTILLLVLFFHTGMAKILDREEFVRSMHKQHFPAWVEWGVIRFLPPAELLAAVLLVPERTRVAGLGLSLAMLTAFTIYIVVVLSGVLPRIPCPCGGIVQAFGWVEHLVFNTGLLLLTGAALWASLNQKIMTSR